jgi:hypothetical protein
MTLSRPPRPAHRFRPSRFAAFAGLCVLGPLLGARADAAGPPIPVSQCETTIPKGQTGIVQSDLSCTPGTSAYRFRLEKGATLDLNGHTITNGTVDCVGGGRCRLIGPGTLTGAQPIPLGPGYAVQVREARLEVRDVEIRDNENGIYGDQQDSVVKATNTIIENNGFYGIYAGKVKLRNVTANGNGALGVGHPLLTAGIVAGRGLTGQDVTANGNAEGGIIIGHPSAGRLQGLTAIGNTGPGVYGAGGPLRLVDSVVTGNTRNGEDVDIRSFRRPSVANTTCGYSASVPLDPPGNDDLGPPWGICAND